MVTDTWDLSGKILVEKKVEDIDKDKVLNALNKFEGKIKQIPPVYSAVKYKGSPSYRLARKGHRLELEPKIVNIYNLELISIEKDLVEIKINCSSGTYIRSLAYDIGGLLGTGASLKELKRTSINDYKLEDSISVEDFIRNVLEGHISVEEYMKPAPYIVPLERLSEKMENIYVKNRYINSIKNGCPVTEEMIEKRLTGNTGGLFKKGSFVNILDSNANLLAVHEIISEKIFCDTGDDAGDRVKNMVEIKQELTKSIIAFGDGVD